MKLSAAADLEEIFNLEDYPIQSFQSSTRTDLISEIRKQMKKKTIMMMMKIMVKSTTRAEINSMMI